jgi:phosphate/phosphite/phosphonate ABC transporter binding protein
MFSYKVNTVFWQSVKNVVIIMVLFLFLPFVTNCSEQTTDAPPAYESSSQKKFYLGLIPEQDLFSQKARYAPLARYISEKAGVNVEIKVLSRYGNIIENFVDGQLDAAFFGSFTGALAIKTIGVEPIARPVWLDDTSTYYGMIFVRKDSNIKDRADMKGKRFAFVDKATTAGWLLPLNYFHEIGIEDYPAWFGETYLPGPTRMPFMMFSTAKRISVPQRTQSFTGLPQKTGGCLMNCRSWQCPPRCQPTRWVCGKTSTPP